MFNHQVVAIDAGLALPSALLLPAQNLMLRHKPDLHDTSHMCVKQGLTAVSCMMQVLVNASTEGRVISSATGFVGDTFPLSVPSAHLWSFDDPFLYDLDVIVLGGRNSEGQSVRSALSTQLPLRFFPV